ncbi:MAG: protein translocase subunit SecF [Dehalococcoidia bacterium]|nr:protein translocase subunit SecF [Dehalococcoidia bacterium]
MNLVRYRRWLFLLSALLVVPSLVALLIPPSLRPGIDFTGGSALTVEFEQAVTTQQVIDALDPIGHGDAIVQGVGGATFFIRTKELEPEVVDASGAVLRDSGRVILEATLTELAPLRVTAVDTVSAVVGAENVRNAIFAVAAASAAILLYVTWAFRRVPNPFRYGTAAIIALVHDVVVVLGVFSLLGKFANVEVNAMFITGVLTVIGYSVNDTIVVFDRLRENVARHHAAPFIDVVNLSVRETIGRSLNTSLTLLVVVAALLMFGGPSIQPLLLVLLVGVVIGAYSSIFVATLLLVSWETGELGRALTRLNPFGGRRQAPAA